MLVNPNTIHWSMVPWSFNFLVATAVVILVCLVLMMVFMVVLNCLPGLIVILKMQCGLWKESLQGPNFLESIPFGIAQPPTRRRCTRHSSKTDQNGQNSQIIPFGITSHPWELQQLRLHNYNWIIGQGPSCLICTHLKYFWFLLLKILQLLLHFIFVWMCSVWKLKFLSLQ